MRGILAMLGLIWFGLLIGAGLGALVLFVATTYSITHAVIALGVVVTSAAAVVAICWDD